MEDDIIIKPIGVIETRFESTDGMPIQGIFQETEKGCCVLDPYYAQGLIDLDGFSHAILLYYFHQSNKETLLSQPFLEDITHGVFSIRSPHRPNKIGMSVVRIEKIMENRLYFYEADMLNGTPLIDIKPYVSFFDHRPDAKSGWIDKHFNNGVTSQKGIIGKK